MERKFRIHFLCFLFAALLILPITLSGCRTATDKDAPEITTDYLYHGYQEQLLTDGAEKIIGSIELSKNEKDEIILTVHPKELIPDEKEESGYRITSYASNQQYTLPPHAYCTRLSTQDSDSAEILSTDDFFTAITEDYKNNGGFSDHGDFILYDIYTLDNQALLILEHIDM